MAVLAVTNGESVSGWFTLCRFANWVLNYSVLPKTLGTVSTNKFSSITLPQRVSSRCTALQLLLDAGAAEPFTLQVHFHMNNKLMMTSFFLFFFSTGDYANRLTGKNGPDVNAPSGKHVTYEISRYATMVLRPKLRSGTNMF